LKKYLKFPEKTMFLVFIAINIIVYLWQLANGTHWFTPDVVEQINWGANVAPLTLQGEPWRLFSSMFLHSGFIHLALNMLMLFYCGQFIEKAFGSVYFSLLYVVSGLFGAVASSLWYANHKVQVIDLALASYVEQLQLVVSVGASGAIMGISGAYLAYWWVSKLLGKADEMTKPMFLALAQTIALNLALGLFTLGIDNAAHIGGLISGAMMGAMLAYKQSAKHLLIMLATASLVLIYVVANVKPSEELIALKQQLQSEIKANIAKKNVEAQQAHLAAEIAADMKTAPKPVDAKTAAGAQLDLSPYLSKNPSLRDMQLTKDGKTLVILAGELDNKLLLVDVKTKAFIAEIKGPKIDFESGNCLTLMCEGKGADTLELSADSRFAYVSSMQKNSVTIVDLVNKSILNSMPAGQYPRAFAANQNSTHAYVTSAIDNTVSVLDLVNQKTIGAPVKLQGGSAENLPFGHADGIWITNQDTQLAVLDAALNQLEIFDISASAVLKSVKTVPMSENFYRDGAMARDAKLWVVGTSGLDAYNLDNGGIDKSYSFCVSAAYYNIAASPTANTIAIAEQQLAYIQEYVYLVKANTGKTLGLYPVVGPQTPVFSNDGKQLYVLSKQQNEQGNASYTLKFLTLANTLAVNLPNGESELLCSASNN
jgi:rhomboid protease GluP